MLVPELDPDSASTQIALDGLVHLHQFLLLWYWLTVRDHPIHSHLLSYRRAAPQHGLLCWVRAHVCLYRLLALPRLPDGPVNSQILVLSGEYDQCVEDSHDAVQP